jgi:hypothetical protein
VADREDKAPSRALVQPGHASGRPQTPASRDPQPPPYSGSPAGRAGGPGAQPPAYRREAPERPPVASPNTPPVLTKVPPPFTVRLSQFLWVLSLLAGAIAVVYLFVIREDQLPLISDAVRAVAEGRSDETYTAAADIIYWSIFGIAVGLILMQIVLLVSFSNRKPNVRWWQLGTVIAQVLLFLLSLEIIAVGQNGPLIRQVLLAQWGLGLLALLFGAFRNALQWTARRYDIRRVGADGGSEF